MPVIEPKKPLSLISNALIVVLTVALGLAGIEILLRIRNADQRNFNIEMWRYAKLLKQKSPLQKLGHEHIPNRSAKLQGVVIALNSLGMRGPEPNPESVKTRVLVLGSSNTLGWGVPQEQTMCALLQKQMGNSTEVYNAGIGNYNASRYVALYEKRLRGLRPTIVVIHYFIRDAETIVTENKNFVLRHSELAVLIYHAFHNAFSKELGIKGLIRHYTEMYQAQNIGYQEMLKAMEKLHALSQEDHFRVVVAMVPDIRSAKPYPFGFIHDRMRQIAGRFGWTFVDFLPEFSKIPSEQLWAMSGDPHINSRGQQIMADCLAPYLKN